MTDYKIFRDYGHAIRNKLLDDINGHVTFELLSELDAIIFRIVFKEFKFKYIVTDVSASLYNDGSDEVVQSIEKCYRRSIMNAFFRTQENKERLEKRRLGIYEEDDEL